MEKKNTNIQLKTGAKSINNIKTGDYANSIIVLKMAAHDVPVFREIQGKGWIYFGKKNEYPDYLLDLYNRSAKHNAIVNGKCKYIYGNGFQKTGDEIVNSENETFNEIIKKAILDCELFYGFYIEVIWDNGGNNIAEFRHLCYSDIRSNKDNTEFYYTENWIKTLSDGSMVTNTQPDQNKDWKVYKPYDENNKIGEQIFFYKGYRPGLKTYPLPEYQGSVVYIDIDVQIADYWNNAIHNGLSASHIINFYNGIPTETEQKKLEEGISKKLTGARSSKFILNFTDKKESGSDVQSLAPEDLDKHLQILNETVQQEIYAGHGIVNPMLFGIKTAGQLGGRTELIEANELFQNLYVTPKQQLFEKLFGVIAAAKGIKGEMKLGKIEPIGIDLLNSINGFALLTDEEKRIAIGKEPIIKDKKSIAVENVINSINTLSPMVANNVLKSMTTNEVRSLAGLPPVKGGDIIPTPSAQAGADANNPSAPAKFSAEQELILLEQFKKLGKKRGGKVISQRPMEVAYIKNLAQNEAQYIDFAKREIKANPSNAIWINPSNPLISPTGEPLGKLEVVYKYDWRDAVPTGERDTAAHPSRDFCVEMMSLSDAGTTYTREDIDGLSNDMTDPDMQDVWTARGGWLTIQGSDVHVPSCRHIWKQVVIIT